MDGAMSRPLPRVDLDDHADHPTQATPPVTLLERLHYVTDSALAHLTVDELLDERLDRVRDALRVDATAALLFDQDEQTLVVMASHGPDGQRTRGARVTLSASLAAQPSADRRALVVADVTRAAPDLPLMRGEGVTSLMSAPMMVADTMLGLLQVGTREPRAFADEEAQLLQLVADRAALALDRARLYEAERQARLASEAAVSARDEFMAIAAHEIKTPLTAVKSAAQLVIRGLNRPELQRAELTRLAATLDEQIARLEQHVGDLLDVSRLQGGRLALRLEEFDLAELSAEVLERAKLMPEHRAGHTLTLDSAGPLIGTWDRARLDRALTNLVSNAMTHLRRGGDVRIALRQERDGAEVAISGRHRPTAAEAAEREAMRADAVEEVRRQAHESLMAGLFITGQTIERHNATINIAADLDGVTYTLWFPLTQPGSLVAHAQQ
jgi:K+-sensing histidine kinase KdpD